MTMKNSFIIFILLPFSCVFFQHAKGQDNKSGSQKIYFKSARGPYWTKAELDSFLLSKNNNRYKLVTRLTGKEEHTDSLIYRIDIIMDPAPVDENNKPLAGQQLPDFDFKDLSGNKVSAENLKGKPVVINFWFTSCAPCIAEMRALNVIREKYKKSDVVFLAITFDKKTPVLNFLKKHFFNFTIIPDAASYCNHITSIYPITLFVDRNGLIRKAEHLIPSSRDPETSLNTGYLDVTSFEKNIDLIIVNDKN
jgi:peroxiredoxin